MMIEAISHALSLSGLIWLGSTLLFYWVGLRINRKYYRYPISHPLIFTAVSVGTIVFLSNTSIEIYQQSASFLHWLLGPVTVALALPIYRQWQRLHHYGLPLLLSIMAGGVVAPIFAWAALWCFDSPISMQLTMLAKSITTPLAMEASAQIGGIPALAAVFVITTGVVGAIAATSVFRLFDVTDTQAQGVALGTVAHAVGTAKSLQMGDEVAAMATLGLCVNGIFTAIILPIIFSFLSP
ncbi:LrgB family protein [Alteromonas sp. 1_MG-2023]|uniref:LrgB family protein n=1 Tax=Alteromonas sp. 1_MG-2023 TaxID=3062669 RepID=UPI0026E432E7|nr:LrgB family protein [Alteromonas sp. 1_MG-2023]MDO6565527.1 LrgB family protein [Alteromonas sp. 1_MG-2023]